MLDEPVLPAVDPDARGMQIAVGGAVADDGVATAVRLAAAHLDPGEWSREGQAVLDDHAVIAVAVPVIAAHSNAEGPRVEGDAVVDLDSLRLRLPFGGEHLDGASGFRLAGVGDLQVLDHPVALIGEAHADLVEPVDVGTPTLTVGADGDPLLRSAAAPGGK